MSGGEGVEQGDKTTPVSHLSLSTLVGEALSWKDGAQCTTSSLMSTSYDSYRYCTVDNPNGDGMTERGRDEKAEHRTATW